MIGRSDLTTSSISMATVQTTRGIIELVSVYLEPNSNISANMQNLVTTLRSANSSNIIIAGDVNARNRIWSSNSTDQRGRAVADGLAELDMFVLSKGSASYTNETFRNDTLVTSIIDITAVSSSMLNKVAEWRVDRERGILCQITTTYYLI